MTWMQISLGVLVILGSLVVTGCTLATKHTEVRALGSVAPKNNNNATLANREQKMLRNIIVGACTGMAVLLVAMTWL